MVRIRNLNGSDCPHGHQGWKQRQKDKRTIKNTKKDQKRIKKGQKKDQYGMVT